MEKVEWRNQRQYLFNDYISADIVLTAIKFTILQCKCTFGRDK